MARQILETIKFTEDEIKLFEKIRVHAASLNPPCVPRLVGGYVRDRLLGMKCHDIDIALDNISGYDFAVSLSQSYTSTSRAHKILANPEKSKHLETAVLTMDGFCIDFSRLRSETYANTRIPDVRPGTPQEDANRRDITVNALFYNLESNKLEDFTGRGLKDLQERRIDTPLDPAVTLLEDPLRILRIFRFRAKLGFKIAPRIYTVLKECTEMRSALASKVSKERIGIEILKIMNYNKGHLGFMEIVQTQYVGEVLGVAGTSYRQNDLRNGKYVVDIPRSTAFMSLFSLIAAEFYNIPQVIFFEAANTPIPFPNLTHCFWKRSISRYPRSRDDIPEIYWPYVRLYILLHNFSGIKITPKRYANYEIVKDALKLSNEKSEVINVIENGMIACQAIIKSKCASLYSIVGFVMSFKKAWPTILILSAMRNDNPAFVELFMQIVKKKYTRCYVITPLVTGNDIKDKIRPKDMKEALKWSHIHQVIANLNSKESIIRNLLEKYSQK